MKIGLWLLGAGIILNTVKNTYAKEKLEKNILVKYSIGSMLEIKERYIMFVNGVNSGAINKDSEDSSMLIIYKDGGVCYDNVKNSIYTLRDTFTESDIDSIIKIFNQNNFFSLREEYSPLKDSGGIPKYTLTYNSDSIKKTVTVKGECPEQILQITSELNARIEKLKVDKYASIIEISQNLRDRLLLMVPPPCPNKTQQQGVNDTISIQLKLKVDENRRIMGEPQVIVTTGCPEWDKEIMDFIKSKWRWTKTTGILTEGSITI